MSETAFWEKVRNKKWNVQQGRNEEQWHSNKSGTHWGRLIDGVMTLVYLSWVIIANPHACIDGAFLVYTEGSCLSILMGFCVVVFVVVAG